MTAPFSITTGLHPWLADFRNLHAIQSLRQGAGVAVLGGPDQDDLAEGTD